MMSPASPTLTQRLDRLWWLFIILLAALLSILFWIISSPSFSFLGNLRADGRSGLYSAIAGISAGLLGFSFAAIAILTAIPRQQNARFKAARNQTVSVLLAVSLVMGISLVLALIGMIIDQGSLAPAWLASSLIGTLLASVFGLVLGGLSLAILIRAID
jgi:hypothetical protein